MSWFTFARRSSPAILLALVSTEPGCSSSDASHAAAAETDAGDRTLPDAGVDATPPKDATPPDGGGADSSVRPPPTFLDPTVYSEWLIIDAKFPFDVTSKHATTGRVGGARWGRHNGPMLTTEVYKAPGQTAPGVIRWTIPAKPTDDVIGNETPFTKATGLPAQLFYGVDGIVDMPFGLVDLLSYTGTGSAFPGEVLLYSQSLNQVTSRANVNGFYSGVGLTTPSGGRILYSGLSPLSATTSTTNANGLYASDVCNGSLVPAGGCPPGVRLVPWNGSSGPVVNDAHDNVFVAASLSSGPSSDAFYGLAHAQAVASTPQTATTLAEVDTGGASSLTAIAPDNGGLGWVLAKGYDASPAVPAFAQAYAEAGNTLAKSGARIDAALKPGPKAESFSMFADAEGDLWVAVSSSTGGVFLELRRK